MQVPVPGCQFPGECKDNLHLGPGNWQPVTGISHIGHS
jgi:hypothetical protein